MSKSIYETYDKLTVDGGSYYIIEVLYSERMKEHIYVLEDKHVDDWYLVLTEKELIARIKELEHE